MSASLKSREAAGAPHSWEFDSWPAEVWPHDSKRGRWVARAYRKQLVAAGALSRVGRCLVVLGAPYTRWLQGRADQVIEFRSNNPQIGRSRVPARGEAHT
jgi:hypothetical protein